MEQLFSVKLLSIELFLLLFMVCMVNNICNGVAVVGSTGSNGPAGK